MRLQTRDPVLGPSRGCTRLLATALLALAPCTSFAADLGIGPEPSDFNFVDLHWGPWAELGGTYGTEESSYGDLGIFVPLAQTPDSLFFTEIRGKYFENNLLEGNAMLGYRQMTESGFNLGVWGGLDVRYTDSDNTFGQVSGGLEALSQYFDFRVNGYYPFTDPQTADGMSEVVIEGSNIFMIGGEEVPLYGVDGEVGGRLPLGAGNRATVGLYGGGFWFDADDIDEAITGGSARVELALNDVVGAGSQFSAQYEFTDDNVRGDRHLIGARLRIPLGGAPAASDVTPQWMRMVDRIERDVDIVISRSGKEAVEDAMTGVDFEQVVMIDGDAGDSISTASANEGSETLLLATGTFTGDHTLNAGQTLQGGGSTIQVRGLETGVVAGFTAPGAMPVVNGDKNALSIMGGDTRVVGLDVYAPNYGIAVSNFSIGNIVVEQNRIQADEWGFVIEAPVVDNVTVLNNEISGGTNGIGLAAPSLTNIFVYDNYVHNVSRYGIIAGTPDIENVEIIGNRVENVTEGPGILFFKISDGLADIDLVVSDNHLSKIEGTGIRIYAEESATAIVTGNRLEAIDGSGIHKIGAGGTANFLVSDNHLTDVADTVFDHEAAALLPGSVGNIYTDTDGASPFSTCDNPDSGFLEVTVNGVLEICTK